MSTKKQISHEPQFEVYGLKGMKNVSFTKTFKSQAAYEKWLDSPASENYEVLGSRDIERCACGINH